MKHFAFLLSVAATCAPGVALAQHAHGAHDGHAVHGPHHRVAAAAGGTAAWTPDAPLIDGMARVSAAVASLAHMEMGHMTEGQVLTVADTIDAAVEDMFANCKLAPEPDAALHGILARLMAASKALREAPADPAPAAVMRAALSEYARLFDDPEAAARR